MRELVLDAQFSQAVDQARRHLERPDLGAAQRNGTLEVLAIALIANRQHAEAAEVLRRLYSRDPGHRLSDPDASPPVVSAFARARESEPERVTVRLTHEPPAFTPRVPPILEVRIEEGADAVAEVQLSYEVGNDGVSRVVMTDRGDGTYTARVPVLGPETVVTYHVVALAPSLTPLASVGSESEPMQLRLPARISEGAAVAVAQPDDRARSDSDPSDSGPPTENGPPTESAAAAASDDLGEQWWFWTILAAALVGGVVTTAVLVAAQPRPEEGTLGSVTLMQTAF